MNFTTDELYMLRWIVRRYKTEIETDEEKEEIQIIKKKLVFMCKADNFAENVMKDVHLDNIKDTIVFPKVKEVKEEKEEKEEKVKEEKPKKKKKTKTMFIDDGEEEEEKVLKFELPTILVREEKYNRWVNNCKTNKSGSSWCYLENNNNGRRKVRFYNDKLIYHNGGQWGLFKKVWTAPESTTQSNENVDNQ